MRDSNSRNKAGVWIDEDIHHFIKDPQRYVKVLSAVSDFGLVSNLKLLIN